MVDQREALAVTMDLLTQFIWFALPGFEPSTPGSASINPAFHWNIKRQLENRLLMVFLCLTQLYISYDVVINFLLIYAELATVSVKPYQKSDPIFCTLSIKVILYWSMQCIFPFQCE